MRRDRMLGSKTAQELSEEFYAAAQEDYEHLEYSRLTNFRNYGNACMLAARYAEKMLKARLLRIGEYPERNHNLRQLVMSLPPFHGSDRALEIAADLEPYAVQAAYPSLVRDTISPENAREAYDMAMEIVRLTAVFDGDVERRPRTRQTRLFSRRSRLLRSRDLGR